MIHFPLSWTDHTPLLLERRVVSLKMSMDVHISPQSHGHNTFHKYVPTLLLLPVPSLFFKSFIFVITSFRTIPIYTNMPRGYGVGLGPLCHADYLGKATWEPFGKFSHVTNSESNILFCLHSVLVLMCPVEESWGFSSLAERSTKHWLLALP